MRRVRRAKEALTRTEKRDVFGRPNSTQNDQTWAGMTGRLGKAWIRWIFLQLHWIGFFGLAVGERSFDSLSLLESLRIKQMSMVHLPCIDWLNNVKHLCFYLYYMAAMKLSTATHSGFKSSLKLHIGCGCLPELSPNETNEQC